MSNPMYFCYSCNRDVRSQDSDLKCSLCGGEFIEELPHSHPMAHMGAIPGGRGQGSRRVGGAAGDPQSMLSSLTGGHMPTDFAMAMGNFMEQLSGGSGIPHPHAHHHHAHSHGPGGGPPGGVHVHLGPQPHAPAPTPAEGAQEGVGGADGDNSITNFLNQLLGGLAPGQAGNVQFRITVNGQPAGGQVLPMVAGNIGDYAWGTGGLDRIVTNLLNQFDANQPEQGLNATDIDRVPVVKVSQKHVDNVTQCTTCMETFNLEESVMELNCRHIFHRDCLVPWLERHRTCPICRQEIDPTQWPDSQPAHAQMSADVLDELD